jgi:hypothetical protein
MTSSRTFASMVTSDVPENDQQYQLYLHGVDCMEHLGDYATLDATEIDRWH